MSKASKQRDNVSISLLVVRLWSRLSLWHGNDLIEVLGDGAAKDNREALSQWVSHQLEQSGVRDSERPLSVMERRLGALLCSIQLGRRAIAEGMSPARAETTAKQRERQTNVIPMRRRK